LQLLHVLLTSQNFQPTNLSARSAAAQKKTRGLFRNQVIGALEEEEDRRRAVKAWIRENDLGWIGFQQFHKCQKAILKSMRLEVTSGNICIG